MNKPLVVKVLKYGGKLHYEWTSTIIEQNANYVTAYSTPGRKLIHHTKDKEYHYDNYSFEFFPKNEWYTVCIDIEKSGSIQYYCNICMPPVMEDGEVNFVDLDIDIVNRAGNWEVVDEDEFAQNQKLFNYPPAIIEQALQAKETLLEKIHNKEFPFNGFLEQSYSLAIKTKSSFKTT